jgi:hypothetical protein
MQLPNKDQKQNIRKKITKHHYQLENAKTGPIFSFKHPVEAKTSWEPNFQPEKPASNVTCFQLAVIDNDPAYSQKLCQLPENVILEATKVSLPHKQLVTTLLHASK